MHPHDGRLTCRCDRACSRSSTRGPCYGYQLRAEFDRRTGSTWPLNVGQIYNTLDRLERDGFVSKGVTDEDGHVYYEITDAGSLEVSAWITSPVERGPGNAG